MVLQEYSVKGHPMAATGIIGQDGKELSAVDVYQTLEAMAAELQQRRQFDWQPIPDDADQRPTYIVLLKLKREQAGKTLTTVVVGHWVKKFSSQYCEWESEDLDYCAEKDDYFDPEGWVELLQNWDDFTHLYIHDWTVVAYQRINK